MVKQVTIKDYDNLSDNDKAHVVSTLDSLSDPVDNDTCVCGVKDCPVGMHILQVGSNHAKHI